MFNAVGWQLTQTGASDGTQTSPISATEDAFKNAIAEQQTIDAHSHDPDFPNFINNNTTIACPNEPRFVSPFSTAKIAANEVYLWNVGASAGMSGIVHSGKRYLLYTQTGDGYGGNGYLGAVVNHLHLPVVPGNINPVWQWTIPGNLVLPN